MYVASFLPICVRGKPFERIFFSWRPRKTLSPLPVTASCSSVLVMHSRVMLAVGCARRKRKSGTPARTASSPAALKLLRAVSSSPTPLLQALLAPTPLPSLMDKCEVESFLNQVVEEVVTRAAKRRAYDAAAEAAEDAKRRNLGEARRARREEIANLLPTSAHVVYDTTGNVCPECLECP